MKTLLKISTVILFLLSLSFQPSCNSDKNDGDKKDTTMVAGTKFGDDFDASNAITVDEMIKKMDTAKKMNCVVKGKIVSVCQKQGCWMRLVKEDGTDMFVNWDEKFFIPKNSGGKNAIVNGYAFIKTTSVEELKDYAQDGGKSKAEVDAIKEPKTELRFMATGVVIE